jgi:hypothetical protein
MGFLPLVEAMITYGEALGREEHALNLSRLTQQVLFNCDVSDARHAGIYSVCGLAMRLRDLYKWERRIAPWQEDEAALVLDWIGAKEDLWEDLLEAEYSRLSVGCREYEAFDTQQINAALAGSNYFYGAGYAHHLKPTFVLAEIDREETVAGYRIRYLGREHARDLLTLPAFNQDGVVILRTEAARMFLWDQIAYISNSGRGALDLALAACGLPDSRTATIRRHYEAVFRVQQHIHLHHEIGELEEQVFNRQIWQQLLADHPHTAVELLARTLKDLLADTGPHGALTILLRDRHAAALGLYMAFGNGMIRLLSQELICAFDAFVQDRRWDPLIRASRSVRRHAVFHAHRVMELFTRGRQRHDSKGTRKAIEDFMRRQGWLSN